MRIRTRADEGPREEERFEVKVRTDRPGAVVPLGATGEWLLLDFEQVATRFNGRAYSSDIEAANATEPSVKVPTTPGRYERQVFSADKKKLYTVRVVVTERLELHKEPRPGAERAGSAAGERTTYAELRPADLASADEAFYPDQR